MRYNVRNFAAFFAILFLTTPSLTATLESNKKQKAAIEQHSDAIKKAFKKGLGITLGKQNKISMVAGGFSKADLFKVRTSKGDLIVKIMKDSPDEDILTEITAAKITGDIGVGPKLHYSNLETKILLLSFINNYNTINRHKTPFHKLVAHEIRKFHDAKLLNRNDRFFDILKQDEHRLIDLKIVSSFLKKNDAALYAEMAKEVKAIFEQFPNDIRPVHHDISPHNVLYDQNKAWLIDYETASNDYYSIDLCMFANFHIYDETLLPQFLEAYYGRKATALERAKFDVIRPFCYAFHGFRLAFLSDQKSIPKMGRVMEYKNFQLAIRQGKFALGSPKSLFILAVSTMNKAVSMLRGKEFKEGLKILREHLKEKDSTV